MTKTKKQLRAEAVESTTERGMTNIEWLYEHDEYLNSIAKLMACLHGFSTDEFTANEWLMQEHANDDSAPEKDVSGGAVDVTTKQPDSKFDVPKSGKTTENSTAKNEIRDFDDTREKLEADVRKVLQSAYMYAWMHGYENRRGCSFEKLHREFYNLLDRQATITEREFWEGYSNGNQWEMYELQRQVDEQTAERDIYREKLSRALDLAHEIERLMP